MLIFRGKSKVFVIFQNVVWQNKNVNYKHNVTSSTYSIDYGFSSKQITEDSYFRGYERNYRSQKLNVLTEVGYLLALYSSLQNRLWNFILGIIYLFILKKARINNL